MTTLTEKSEIFFLYETQYSQPNGDPFTGEQRYDEETKKVLVSDVRIKRFIRDYLEEKGYPILVSEKVAGGKSSMKEILKSLASSTNFKGKTDVSEIMQAHIDVRLFGGISTLEKGDSKIKVDGKDVQLTKYHSQITGPVQFAMLNPSLNKVDLRPHQNTSILLSKEGNTQGSIATTSTVPYALILIKGWINPISAKYSGLSQEDLNIMLRALWDSVNDVNTRSKHGTSLLLIQVVYNENQSKVYGLDRKITLNPNGRKEEALRAFDELTLDLSELIEATGLGQSEDKGKVKKVRIYTEIEAIKEFFMDGKQPKSKIEFIDFPAYNAKTTTEDNENTNSNS